MIIRLSSKENLDIILTSHVILGGSLGPNFSIIYNSLNSIIFLKNRNDKTTLKVISRRMWPKNPDFLVACEENCSRLFGSFSYIVVDSDPKKKINDYAAVRSNIFLENKSFPYPVYFKNP